MYTKRQSDSPTFLTGFFFCLLLSLMSTACSDVEFRRGRVNMFGNVERTNSYEKYGTFNSTLIMEVDLKARKGEERLSLAGAIAPPLVLHSDLIVLAGSDGVLSKVSADKVDWQVKLPNESVVASAMVADAHQNLYMQCSDGILRSYDTTGALRWEHRLSDAEEIVSYSDLLVFPGRIVACDSRGRIHCVDTAGTVKWKRISTEAIAQVPAGDSSGNLYAFNTHNKYGESDSLNKYDETGGLLWSRPFAATRLFKGPIIVDDKTVVAGVKQNGENRVPVMHVLNRMGRVVWSRELAATPRGLSASADGTLFVTSYDAAPGDTRSVVSAITPQGDEEWSREFNFKIPGAALVSRNALAFTGIRKNSSTGLYLLRRDGSFREVISMSALPIVNLHAAAGNNADVIYAMSEKLGYVAIGESSVHRIIPF